MVSFLNQRVGDTHKQKNTGHFKNREFTQMNTAFDAHIACWMLVIRTLCPFLLSTRLLCLTSLITSYTGLDFRFNWIGVSLWPVLPHIICPLVYPLIVLQSVLADLQNFSLNITFWKKNAICIKQDNSMVIVFSANLKNNAVCALTVSWMRKYCIKKHFGTPSFMQKISHWSHTKPVIY